MKKCSSCGLEKDSKLFSNYKRSKDGLHSCCKECNRLSALKWQNNNTDKYHKLITARNRKSRTGYTQEEYDLMFVKQEGCCAICCKSQLELKRALSADHCHSTGAKRGLLCFHCNTALGKFNDDVKLLKSAIDYLENGVLRYV